MGLELPKPVEPRMSGFFHFIAQAIFGTKKSPQDNALFNIGTEFPNFLSAPARPQRELQMRKEKGQSDPKSNRPDSVMCQ